MALKNLIIDRDERTAMDLVRPIWHELWPHQAAALYDGIVAALRAKEK